MIIETAYLAIIAHPNVVSLIGFEFNNTEPIAKWYLVLPLLAYDLAGLILNPEVNLVLPHIKSLNQQAMKWFTFMRTVSCILT
jgi:hypothetical protein